MALLECRVHVHLSWWSAMARDGRSLRSAMLAAAHFFLVACVCAAAMPKSKNSSRPPRHIREAMQAGQRVAGFNIAQMLATSIASATSVAVAAASAAATSSATTAAIVSNGMCMQNMQSMHVVADEFSDDCDSPSLPPLPAPDSPEPPQTPEVKQQPSWLQPDALAEATVSKSRPPSRPQSVVSQQQQQQQ